MNVWLFLIPVISALIGYGLHTIVVNSLFRKLVQQQPQLAAKIGKVAGTELISFDALGEKITSPENIQKIMPLAETHIDHFLRTKLGKAFPMISMFIGDKTINQLKEVFMQELQEIFPVLMKGYVNNLQQDLNIEQLVSEKIAAIPSEKLEVMLRQVMGTALRKLQLLGALTGFLIGLIQVVITLTIA